MRSFGYGLGLGLNRAGAGVPWVRPNSLLDADFSGGRFHYAGRQYATKAAFLVAIGGSEAAGAIAVGPYDIPGAPEKVSNGDFSAGLSGWTAYALTGTANVSVASGVAQLQGNSASNPGFSQLLALDKGHAYRLRGKIRQVSQPPSLLVARNANMTGTTGAVLSDNVTSLHERDSTFSAQEAALYVGTRQYANPSTGTSEFDDISVKAVLPFPGFVQGGFAAIVSGVMPAAASGENVIAEWSDGALTNSTYVEHDCVRLLWDATKHLRLVVRTKNVEQVNLDLGVIEVSMPFEVLLSVKANEFRASLRGGPVLADNAGELPGIARLYLKRQNDAGSTFDGTLARVTLFAKPWSEGEFLEQQAAIGSIAAWGDSLTSGVGATTSYPAAAAATYNPDRSIAAFGLGTQTSTQVAARQGGRAITVTVAADQIPASGGVAVTDKSINILHSSGVFQGTQKGWLATVYGTMSTDASGNWTFTREAPGSVTPCPAGSKFLPELAVRLRYRTQWLWLGRNGAQSGFTVASDIAAAVSWLGHERYLVASILTGAEDSAGTIAQIQGWNAELAAAHGSRYVDVYTALRAAHDGSANDLADLAAGLIPRSLRSDSVHLNDAGYTIVAASFKAANDAMGW